MLINSDNTRKVLSKLISNNVVDVQILNNMFFRSRNAKRLHESRKHKIEKKEESGFLYFKTK